MHMRIQQALLPHKHVRFGESTLAVAGIIRRALTEPRTIEQIEAAIRGGNGWIRSPSFTEIVLGLDILYAIQEIQLLPDGRLQRRLEVLSPSEQPVPVEVV